MRLVPRLSFAAAITAAAALGAAGLAPAASSADSASAPSSASDDAGRGPAPTTSALRTATAPRARVAEAAPESRAGSAGSAAEIEMPSSYPYEPQLTVYDDNPGDGAAAAELLGHDDLAPMLMDMMERSNRLSVQVVGRSTAGRDLYLATVTAPETVEQTARQTAWRETIKEDPEAAAADAELLAGYKTPVWISNNIHGNEWEGTDAAMSTIADLVDAPWTEVSDLLREHRLYFSLSLNPDGRTLATRATALGLDPNRDMITNTTPETTSFIRTAHAIQPLYAADFHGYTSVLQIEPCGPPHGENYEYDLFLPQAYALALAVEEDVVAADIPGNTYFNVDTRRVVAENTGPETAHIKIPYRDTPSGWDDYPPIFSAQYAAFFGASTSTVELPLSRGGAGGTQTPERAVVNQAVAEETMSGIIDYFHAESDAFLANQIEAFRRGVAGEPKVSLTAENIGEVPGPDQWKEIWNGEEGREDDQDPVELPRAYVIPLGEDQRSASDAHRLVRQLLLHDIEVATLDSSAQIGGTTYPAGSYVVDMHQPLRGLANSLLDLGTDISDKVPSMYDISAWSYSYTWGASVDKAGSTEDGPLPSSTPVSAPVMPATLPAAGEYLTFDLAGVADFAAVNALLDEGVAVAMLEDGSAVVAPGDRAAVGRAVQDFGITVAAATDAQLDALADEATKALDDLDVVYVGSQDDKLSLAELGFDDAVAVTASAVDADPSLVTGADVLWVGSSLNVGSAAQDAIQAWVDAGHSIVGRTHQAFAVASTYGLVSGTVVNGNSSGNGIVAVDTPEASPLAPYAQDHAFIYPAYWFTDLGEGTTAAQTYDAEEPFLAGHWRVGTRGTFAGVDGPDDAAGQASVVVGEAESGARAVVFGTSVFFRTHPKGGLSQAARALLWAGPEGAAVTAPEPEPEKARVTAGLRVSKVRGAPRKVKVAIRVRVPGQDADLRVVLKDRRRTLRSLTLPDSGRRTVTVRLRRGTHRLRVVVPATATTTGDVSRVVRVRIR